MKKVFVAIASIVSIHAQAGLFGTPIPAPPVPLPPQVCRGCPCDPVACAREADEKRRQLEAEAKKAEQEAARTVREETERQAKIAAELLRKAADETLKREQQVRSEASKALEDTRNRVEEVSEMARKDFIKRVEEAEQIKKNVEKVASNPQNFENWKQAASDLVQQQIESAKARFQEIVQFLLKNSLQAQIKKHQVLIVISELEKDAPPGQEALYKFVQHSGVEGARDALSGWYDHIVVLEKSEATKENLKKAIASEAGREEIKAIDLFVFVHGTNETLWFFDGGVNTQKLGEEIESINPRGKLRFVYNTACFGESHLSGLRRAGFKLAVGSMQINSNAGTEYPAFLTATASGLPFSIGIAAGDDSRANAMWDGLAAASGLSPTNSQKVMSGDLTEGFLTSGAKWVIEGVIRPF